MSEQQPEAVWVFPPDRPRRGRVWLIVILSVVAVVIAGLVAFFLLRPGASPQPSTSPTPSSSPSSSPTPTPTPSPTITAPVTSPPPVDPDLGTFRADVAPVLDDALTGLGFVADSTAQEAAQIAEQLQEDYQRLSDRTAPSSIESQWRADLGAYGSRLQQLQDAVSRGSGVPAAVDAARAAVGTLQALVGA